MSLLGTQIESRCGSSTNTGRPAPGRAPPHCRFAFFLANARIPLECRGHNQIYCGCLQELAPMRVALYARVSTCDQTVDPQLDALQAYALARRLDVVGEFVDHGISGSKDRRSALDRLMTQAKRRAFDAVAVVKLDRMARSTRHLTQIAAELEALGIDLIVTDQGIDTSTPAALQYARSDRRIRARPRSRTDASGPESRQEARETTWKTASPSARRTRSKARSERANSRCNSPRARALQSYVAACAQKRSRPEPCNPLILRR